MKGKLFLFCMAWVLVSLLAVGGCDNGDDTGVKIALGEKAAAQADLAKAEADLTTAQAQVASLTAGLAQGEADLTTAQAQVTSLTAGLAQVEAVLAEAQEPVLTDTVKTEAGYISGTVMGEPGKEVHIFRGIPYAAPPVGELRWEPPQPVAPWSGIRECTVFSVQAAQWANPVIVAVMGFEEPSSEDCLYLNVLTPAKKPSDRFPVMVWFHGGGYYSGNSNVSYNNPTLPQHGVVLVTVNQRLGVMGLMAHPLLSKESPNSVSGNYMFLAAVKK
jgi:hypothetical protein